MRRAAKRDGTERAIVGALEAVGCKVQKISQGDGAPDLIVADPDGRLSWLELKSPGGHLTQQQVRWAERWGWPVSVVATPVEALEALGVQDVQADAKRGRLPRLPSDQLARAAYRHQELDAVLARRDRLG